MKCHATSVNWLQAALAGRYESAVWKCADVELVFEDSACAAEAMVHFERGEALRRSYQPTEAMRAFTACCEVARQSDNRFIMALAHNQIAMCFSRSLDAACKCLEEALEHGKAAIDAATELLWQQRAKKEIGRAVLTPMLELNELIAENLEQFSTLRRSHLMKVRRDTIDNIIGEQEPGRAEYYAQTALQEATESFGQTHFWAGIMEVRLADALARQEKFEEARRHGSQAVSILREWVMDENDPRCPLAQEYRSAVLASQVQPVI